MSKRTRQRARRPGDPGRPTATVIRGCWTKIRHVSQAEADKHANDLIRQGLARVLRTYRCEYCGGLHLTRIYAPPV